MGRLSSDNPISNLRKLSMCSDEGSRDRIRKGAPSGQGAPLSRQLSGRIRRMDSVLQLPQNEAFKRIHHEVVIGMLQQGHMRIFKPG
jgi:hypothetical protein